MSNIDVNSIDETYPVPGQDNDSQGFRDNFAQIKTGLAIAAAEITDLEIRTAKVDTDNNFAYNIVQSPLLVQSAEKVLAAATDESFTINWSHAMYQKIIVRADLTLTLDNWPSANKFAKIRVLVTSGAEGTFEVTWAAANGNNIKKTVDFPTTFSIASESDPKIFEFWTDDGGATVYGQYLGEFTE